MNDFARYSDTTEPDHSHYCRTCGGIWSHEDEVCVGPRLTRPVTYATPTYECPICMEDI